MTSSCTQSCGHITRCNAMSPRLGLIMGMNPPLPAARYKTRVCQPTPPATVTTHPTPPHLCGLSRCNSPRRRVGLGGGGQRGCPARPRSGTPLRDAAAMLPGRDAKPQLVELGNVLGAAAERQHPVERVGVALHAAAAPGGGHQDP
jgi:hypothetical protein